MKMAEAASDDRSSHHDEDDEEDDDFPPDFKEYMQRELYWSRLKNSGKPDADLDLFFYSDSDWESNRWVFWSRQDDNFVDLISDGPSTPKIRDQIKHALQKIILFPHLNVSLVQFWAATTILEGRTLLTTKSQPFALGKTDHALDRQGLCEYRMISKEYEFYGDADCEAEEIGLPGRVFLNKFPETTPNVEYYSVREYPQRDHALRCQVRQSWAMPVFMHSSRICVGVLELVSTRDSILDWFDLSFLNYLEKKFQGQDDATLFRENVAVYFFVLICKESSGTDELEGLGEWPLSQLQHLLEKLNIGESTTKSLHRLARNAERRYQFADLCGDSLSDGDTSVVAEGIDEYNGSAVAHLLFHKPSEFSSPKSHTMNSSVIPPRDGLSLMSHTMGKNENSTLAAAFDELNMALEVLCGIHKLPLALTWVQCSACDELLRGHIDYGDLNNAPATSFLVASNALHLRKWQGVVGRALSSSKLIYCSDVTQLSIAEYPLVHHARFCGLCGWFAICLKSTYTGDDFYVIEFFLPGSNKGSQKPWTLLSRILGTLKESFKTFNLASGEEMREELDVEVIDFQNGQKLHSVHKIRAARSLFGLEPLQNEGLTMQLCPTDQMDAYSNGRNVVIAEQRNYVVVTNAAEGTKNTQERVHKKTGVRIEITLEDILQTAPMKRKDAASKLKVSQSTFKRVCREYGIRRWPPRNLNEVHPPRPSCVNQQEGIPQLNSDLLSNDASAIVACTRPPDAAIQNGSATTIKAKYGNDIMLKFQLSLPPKLVVLQQAVARRLNLEPETYYVKYKDEEDDLILIGCDADLQDCIRTSRLLGSTSTLVLLEPK